MRDGSGGARTSAPGVLLTTVAAKINSAIITFTYGACDFVIGGDPM